MNPTAGSFRIIAKSISLGFFVALVSTPPVHAKERPGEAIYKRTCVACHGEKAEGNPELKSPPIASLPRWYSKAQLDRFKSGVRGKHPEDLTGQQMSAISVILTEDDISELSEYLVSLPPADHEAPEKGDATEGKAKFLENCASCHRFNAAGEQVFRSAPLVKFPAWYLRAQFEKFKSGQRGYDPEDKEGAKMKVIAATPGNVASFDDILAYIAELQKEE